MYFCAKEDFSGYHSFSFKLWPAFVGMHVVFKKLLTGENSILNIMKKLLYCMFFILFIFYGSLLSAPTPFLLFFLSSRDQSDTLGYNLVNHYLRWFTMKSCPCFLGILQKKFR